MWHCIFCRNGIKRSRMDGNYVETVVSKDDAGEPGAIAVHGNYIYWVDKRYSSSMLLAN